MNVEQQINWIIARRQFLKTSGMGLGASVLGTLMARDALAGTDSGYYTLTPTPKVKHVIFLFMAGAPSQIELFDYKPELEQQFRKPLPPSVSMGQRVTAMTRGQEQLIAPSKFKFARAGENGIWMSELLPHLSQVADDLCIVNSLSTNAINHDPGKNFLCTGSEIPGRASIGAWLS
jgi:hypothetical protein